MEDDDEELTSAAAARLIGISPQRMSQLGIKNQIPSRLVAGFSRVFRKADVLAYAARTDRKPGRPKKRNS